MPEFRKRSRRLWPSTHAATNSVHTVTTEASPKPRGPYGVYFWFHNDGPETVFFGGPNVTPENGIPLAVGETDEIIFGGELYFVTADDSSVLRIMELA